MEEVEIRQQAVFRQWRDWYTSASRDQLTNFDSPRVLIKDESNNWAAEIISLRSLRKRIYFPQVSSWASIHEIIPSGFPCRLVVDCDKKNIEGDGSDAEAMLQSVIADIREKFAAVYGGRDVGKCMIKDATSLPRKFSDHIVFPNAWFATPGDVGRFMQDIASKYPADFIDTGIYSDNSLKSLRLPYCAKLSDPHRALIPRGSQRLPDWDLFLECVASCTIATPPPYEECLKFGKPKSESAGGFRSISVTHVSRIALGADQSDGEQLLPGGARSFKDDPNTMKCIEDTLKYLRCIYGEFKIVSNVKVDDLGNWECVVDPPFFCAAKHARGEGTGFHQSNKSYIGTTDRETVYAWCADPQCRQRIYLGENMSMLLTGRRITQGY